MIPFSSQRGLGQDLATHLLNTHDNEHMELAHLRGAIAPDLHGAFAEWELQADALTNCRNYLYSLSINPDPSQAPLSRAQYLDYAERVEAALGLAGQPRALVFHVKHEREHAHIVWSRIDAENGKAIHMPFDHEKLMQVTRQFAHDHSLELPDGYFKDDNGADKTAQLSLYEKYQQDSTGLTKEQRMDLVTELWRGSDSAPAFVQALGQNGYMLATGKRPYVLVDVYGDTQALPKLINDKRVRTKDVKAFLAKDFPPESLPSVEDAKKLTADHRKSMEAFETARAEVRKDDEIQLREAQRRKAVLEKIKRMKQRQLDEKRKLEAALKQQRMKLKNRHLKDAKRTRLQREKVVAKGLPAFLGRVTGMDKVMRQVRRFRDRARYERYKKDSRTLSAAQGVEVANLRERHRMQLLDIRREVRSVDKVEKREVKSRKLARLKEARTKQRGRSDIEHMPAIDKKRYDAVRAKVKPVGRAKEGQEKLSDRGTPARRNLDQWRGGMARLSDMFTRAAKADTDDEKGDRDSGGKLKPKSIEPEHIQRRKRDQDKER
ncbi:MAG: relaxase/mobilization nuclease domain-containing protein [Gammaproteobacteria bacterium]